MTDGEYSVSDFCNILEGGMTNKDKNQKILKPPFLCH